MGDKRTRLDKLIDMMVGGNCAGERCAAFRAADQMLEAAGSSWDDILLKPIRTATEACEALLAEREALNARIAELERAQPDWKPVERVTIGNHNRAAKWLRQKSNDSEIWLSPTEKSIVGTCAAWIGPLTPKQQAFVQSVVNRVHQQYGFAPPP